MSTGNCAGNNGPALSASFNLPNILAVNNSQLYVSDYNNGAIRLISNFLGGASATTKTVAGTCATPGTSGDGLAVSVCVVGYVLNL